MPGKTRDCTLAQNIMFKYKLVGFEFYEAMLKELSLLLTPAIFCFVFLPELPRAADQNVCKQSWVAQAELC